MNVTAAHAFAVELRRAQERRNVTTRALAEAVGVSQRHVVWWRLARSLPYVASAVRVADALDWPPLVDIVRRARTFTCVACGRRGVSEGTGAQRRYCDESCRRLGTKAGKARKLPSTTDNKLRLYGAAVGNFCLDCAPSGLCHDAACQLRPVSPLPHVAGLEPIAPAVDGRRSRWDDPQAREKASAQMRELHSMTPDWRARVSAKNRARWAAMTDKERAAMGKRISDGLRRRKVAAA